MSLIVLVISPLQAATSSNLLENSPFLPPDAAARAGQQAAPLELRSILLEDGRYEFSLYDPSRKQSTWVGLDEKGNDFVVTSFDPSREVVGVSLRGHTYTLALKEATIAPLETRPVPGLGSKPPVGGENASTSTISPATRALIERLRDQKRQRDRAEQALEASSQAAPRDQ